jgi:hypothetical protein
MAQASDKPITPAEVGARGGYYSLNEAFHLIADAAATKINAKIKLIQLPACYSLYDAINLVTEEAMSEAGRTGSLQFSGWKSEYAAKERRVPTTWFEARGGSSITSPRGVDPDNDMLLFSPLHNPLHDDFDEAVAFEVQGYDASPRWFNVTVQAGNLSAFLSGSGGAIPAARPTLRRPSGKVINDILAQLRESGAEVTERIALQEFRNQGYAPTRNSVRDAMKAANLTRGRGRPPTTDNSPKS